MTFVWLHSHPLIGPSLELPKAGTSRWKTSGVQETWVSIERVLCDEHIVFILLYTAICYAPRY